MWVIKPLHFIMHEQHLKSIKSGVPVGQRIRWYSFIFLPIEKKKKKNH